jgi:hypothetical protein
MNEELQRLELQVIQAAELLSAIVRTTNAFFDAQDRLNRVKQQLQQSQQQVNLQGE